MVRRDQLLVMAPVSAGPLWLAWRQDNDSPALHNLTMLVETLA